MSRTSEYLWNMLRSVVTHALGHRRVAGTVISNLINNFKQAERQGVNAYFTICHETAKRGHQNRQTQKRIIVDELTESEFLRITPVRYQPYTCEAGTTKMFVSRRMWVCWSQVLDYARRFDISPMRAPKGTKVRTHKQWKAEMEAYRARATAAAIEAQAQRERMARQLDQDRAKRAAEAADPRNRRPLLLERLSNWRRIIASGKGVAFATIQASKLQAELDALN